MRLIIFGPQGAGKGTQSARLAEKYSIVPISTGDIFRWAISKETELGLKAKQYVQSGRLVPDDVTIGVVKERLAQGDVRDGFLLDGFPRTIDQADALGNFLAEQGDSLDAALVLRVPEEVSLRRLTGRRVCSKCGRNYHLDSPPQTDWTCDRCGGEVIEREDDIDESTVRQRLLAYREQTLPLAKYYEGKGLLRTVDGVGSQDEVFDRIVAAL